MSNAYSERRNTYIKTAAVLPAVSLIDAKIYLKQDFDTEDSLITSLIAAATKTVEVFLRASLLTQTLVLQMDCFPDSRVIELKNGPVQSLTHIKYYDSNSTLQTWTQSGNYALDNKSVPPVAYLEPDIYWPEVKSDKRNAIEIEYICGYTAATLIPAEIITAIKFIIKHLYDNRDLYVFGEGQAVELPKSAEWLLWPLRDYRW